MRTTSLFSSLFLVAAFGCGSVSPADDDDDADAAVAGGPKITSVEPAVGPSGGGMTVTLTGTGFGAGENFVVVGGVAATDVSVASDTELTFVLPHGEPDALVDVTVFNATGFGVLWQGFRFNPPPTLGTITPDTGPNEGGTTITITGAGFYDGPTHVMIAEQAATNVTVVDATTITAETPAMVGPPLTLRDVVVENPNGPLVAEAGFRYTKDGLLIASRRASYEPGYAVFDFLYYDPDSGELIRLADLQQGTKAMDVGPGGKLVGLTNTRTSANVIGVVEIDPLTGDVTPRAAINQTDRNFWPKNLAFAGGVAYTVDHSSFLSRIDPATGEVARISAAAMVLESGAKGLVRKDANSLYSVDYIVLNGIAQTLDTIAVADGTITASTPYVIGADLTDTYVQCGGLASVDGTLYATTRDEPALLLSINPTSGAVAVVAELPGDYWPRGLAPTPPSW